ncbi:twin-arginine translocase TatA/TatE family subunit [Deinococcus maricopensis]|uniref:Sec-independent protein translocase protein TatA n=1 Tax=Deinococcus maricopensis (strain DSM 21211 / LMG 22137 / NRRL B-23946 / LB-34) TaxID=709986 RepID=E8U702_DEIML|nr:twin-arginine translocase TatA/TatE family subunit [Deinococcus maricopensis]ADV66841.1 sec-independent translocation protein mttA/Hcf106 [Deinococcus maricopensis DSM 21211]
MGILEIGLIILVLVLLFGAKKIPEIGRGLGQGIKGFREETRDGRGDTTVVTREDGTPRA